MNVLKNSQVVKYYVDLCKFNVFNKFNNDWWVGFISYGWLVEG